MRHTKPLYSAALVLAMTSPALAATFSTIAIISGAPQIGAVIASTLYGTEQSAGTNGTGLLFSISTAGTNDQTLPNFTASVDGSAPNARLALDSRSDLYGTATGGGAYGSGTLWTYTTAGAMKTKQAFGSGTDGAVPMQGPTIGPHNVIYGPPARARSAAAAISSASTAMPMTRCTCS